MKTLPYKGYEFTLFCDNLFGDPRLFSLLRELGIGACGTARRSVTKPVFGNFDAWEIEWGTLRSKIVPETVVAGLGPTTLVSVWQDSNKVGFCTTIHNGIEWTVRVRKKPKATSSLASITKQPFRKFSTFSDLDETKGKGKGKDKDEFEHTRLLPIPIAIHEYNCFMGGVDIADQLRAGLSTQQRGKKHWRPLAYWLLDSSIINSFRLSEKQRKSKLSLEDPDKVRSAHRAFRETLVKALLEDPNPTKAPTLYITKKKSELPQIRLTRPIGIHQLVRGKRAACLFCRWTRQHGRASNWKVITKSNEVPRTQMKCSHCSTPLCEECFYPFHHFVA
jgi:hypothetical protein